MEDCCNSMLKYLIFICNFAFFFSGVVLIGIGTYVKVSLDDYLNFVDDGYLNTATFLIVLGVVILVIGFCGCCGAVTENACMMFTFSTLLAVIVLVEIGCAGAVYMYKDNANAVIKDKMVSALNNYNRGADFEGVTETWNAIQVDFKCCGVSNYTNWAITPFSEEKSVPDSCCITPTPSCGQNALTDTTVAEGINKDGCVSNLEKLVAENAETVAITGIIIVVLQTIGVLVSCMLANNMRRRANYV